MKRDFMWFAAVVFALFIGSGTRDRYQATSVGNKAFVLDKATGEAWMSTKVSSVLNRSEIEMVPVPYASYQYTVGLVGPKDYLPEDTRNDKNAEWSTWIQQKISPPSKNND